MKTYQPKKSDIPQRWVLFDAQGQTLGHLAVNIANSLRGKDTVYYTPNVDTGVYVIVINSDKVAVSGAKQTQKNYLRYSGYMGGLKSATLEEVRSKDSTRIIERAVKNMLPKNRLARQLYTKLFVYTDERHPHQAQKPEVIEL